MIEHGRSGLVRTVDKCMSTRSLASNVHCRTARPSSPIKPVHAPWVRHAMLCSPRLTVPLVAKEIRLKHKAPVLSIVVLDGSNQSIGQGSSITTMESTPVTSSSPAPTTATSESASPASPVAAASHKVLICSEEQFKVRSLLYFKFGDNHLPFRRCSLCPI